MTQSRIDPSPVRTQELRDAQYLTFRIGQEEYAVDILRVQEIRGYSAITPIPNSPNFIKGVMNLRGTVVPVLGLRETFGMEPIAYNKFSVIVVLSVGEKIIGLLVDAVSEVISLSVSQIDMAPELGARVDTSLISGMGHAGDKFVIVLNIEKVVAGVECDGEASPLFASGEAKHVVDGAETRTMGTEAADSP